MQERDGLKIKLNEGVKKIGGGVKRKMSGDADESASGNQVSR
jgi:hypothetical protein